MSAQTSDVAHYAGLDFWNPAGAERVDHLLSLLRLEREARVLDIGCGNAEVLLRIAERYGARVTGVDCSPYALAQARAAFDQRAATFLEQEVSGDSAFGDAWDCIVWIGGPFVGESFPETMRAFTGWLRPGGQLLMGHGFWSQPPAAEYIEAIGIPAEEMTDHAGNIECGEAEGLRPMYSCVSSRDEWDHFEGTILVNSERYAAEHPEAPDPQGALERRRKWHIAQQRWGRDTMGFGFYLFSKPRDT